MNDLLFTQGQDNLAGIVGKIRIVPIEDVATVPALASAATLVLGSNIVLDALRKWSEVYFTDETGKVDFTPIGERDGKGLETKLTIRYPKFTTGLIDWVRSIQNTPSLVAFKMAASGKWYIMGLSQLDISSTALSMDIPVYFDTGEGTTGDQRASQNGMLITWVYRGAHGPVEYTGTFDLDAGT